jgi:uncharacterized repeat protein (TIGR01451 family)
LRTCFLSSFAKVLRLFAGCAALWLGLTTVDLFGQAAGPRDFGDAPLPYPTIQTNNGARHAILQGFRLGAQIDGETDGQPDPNALGDDLVSAAALADEDGVTFVGALSTGLIATVLVMASQTGSLDAWIDFDADGSWAGTADQIFANKPLVAGVNTLNFTVPPGAHAGFTFARFRLSKIGGLSFAGPASDGEVEDYRVQIGQAQAVANLTITNSVSTNSVIVGNNLIYTLVVQNNGPAPADNVTVTDRLPSNVNYVSANSSQGTCNMVNGTVTCTLGSIGVAATASISIIVTPTTATPLNNTACVSAANSDPNAGNNCTTIVTQVTPGQGTAPCDRTNKGTEFWLAFPGNYAPNPANPPIITLCIVGPANTTGLIEVPGMQISTGFVIQPNASSTTVTLSPLVELGSLNDQVAAKGVRVTASSEVSVFVMLDVNFTRESFLALPTAMLGVQYVVLGYQNVQDTVTALNGSQFALVACENNTQVTITPPVAAGPHSPGVPYQITLQRGEAYQLRITNTAPADLSGTIIAATKRVAVFGGHRCANIQSSTAFFCNTLVEQLLPVALWGTSFATLPLASRAAGYTVRVVAATDDTHVQTNNTLAIILNRGQWFERVVSGPALITADKPVFAAQYSPSSDFDGRTNADPFMVMALPVALFGTNHVFCVPASGFPSNYLNIVAVKGAGGTAPQILLDGLPINSPALLNSYNTIGGNLAGMQVKVNPGVHRLSSSSPFAAIAYGYDEYDAYGHLAGMGVGCLNNCLSISCPSNLSVFSTEPNGQHVNFQAVATNSCGGRTVVSCKPEPGSLFPFGTTVVNCEASDTAGSTVSCSFTVTVLAPPVVITTSSATATATATITLGWPLGGTLQVADDLISPFTNLPNAKSPYVVQTAGPGVSRQKFYRVVYVRAAP